METLKSSFIFGMWSSRDTQSLCCPSLFFSLCLWDWSGTASDILCVYNRFQPQCISHLPQSAPVCSHITRAGGVYSERKEHRWASRVSTLVFLTQHTARQKPVIPWSNFLQKNRYRHKHTPPLSTWDPSHSLKEEERRRRRATFFWCATCWLVNFITLAEKVNRSWLRKDKQRESGFGVFLGKSAQDENPVWEVTRQQQGAFSFIDKVCSES